MKHIYLTIAALFAAATMTVQAQNTANGHEYVDLGLPSGTLWATCNVGATNPEDYGDYFAWGETEMKDSYTWSNYKWCNGSQTTLTKYCTESACGTVDNKTVLDLEDDVAHVKWGGGWRMPTKAMLHELCTNCTWTWTTENGVKGYNVASKTNGNSIFLPAAGTFNETLDLVGRYGCYRSLSLSPSPSYYAYVIYFHSASVGENDYYYRDRGYSVRPVISGNAITIVPIVEGTGLMDIPSVHSAALEALTYVGEMTLQAIDGWPHFFSKAGKDLFFFNSEYKLQIADGVTSADNITHELTQAEREMIVEKFTAAQYAADQIAAAKEWFTIGVSFPTSTGIRSINNDQLTTDRSTKSINSEAGALRYNLAGQRVGNDYKGIVVVNGKKRVMK